MRCLKLVFVSMSPKGRGVTDNFVLESIVGSFEAELLR